MSRLPTGLAATLAPQRTRSRLHKRRIRRRRLRRVPTVLPQLALQLANLSLQPRDLLSLSDNKRDELLIGRRSSGRHPTMTNETVERSTRRAGRDLTSYDQFSLSRSKFYSLMYTGARKGRAVT